MATLMSVHPSLLPGYGLYGSAGVLAWVLWPETGVDCVLMLS